MDGGGRTTVSAAAKVSEGRVCVWEMRICDAHNARPESVTRPSTQGKSRCKDVVEKGREEFSCKWTRSRCAQVHLAATKNAAGGRADYFRGREHLQAQRESALEGDMQVGRAF